MVEKTEASFNLIQSIRGGSKYGIRNATHAGEGGEKGRERKKLQCFRERSRYGVECVRVRGGWGEKEREIWTNIPET